MYLNKCVCVECLGVCKCICTGICRFMCTCVYTDMCVYKCVCVVCVHMCADSCVPVYVHVLHMCVETQSCQFFC